MESIATRTIITSTWVAASYYYVYKVQNYSPEVRVHNHEAPTSW